MDPLTITAIATGVLSIIKKFKGDAQANQEQLEYGYAATQERFNEIARQKQMEKIVTWVIVALGLIIIVVVAMVLLKRKR